MYINMNMQVLSFELILSFIIKPLCGVLEIRVLLDS